MERFKSRTDAGRQLAQKLGFLHIRTDIVVLATAGGGVPVGFEIARTLKAPLGVIGIQKIGAPHLDEQPLGAVSADGTHLLNTAMIQDLRLTTEDVAELTENARQKAVEREGACRTGRRFPSLHGKLVLLVDDGIATGATILVAARVAKAMGASEVVAAVPVMPETSLDEVRAEVDHVVCLGTPEPFLGVAHWYYDFAAPQPSEIQDILAKAHAMNPYPDAANDAVPSWHTPCET